MECFPVPRLGWGGGNGEYNSELDVAMKSPKRARQWATSSTLSEQNGKGPD